MKILINKENGTGNFSSYPNSQVELRITFIVAALWKGILK
jgi:hypothetical protein